MHAVEVKGLTKRFVSRQGIVMGLDAVDLTVQAGEFVVLLGASGSGKTTLLRCIAGLEQADEGELSILGTCVFSSPRRIHVPSEKRDIGMVFQSYAIWPHMSVLHNVMLPLLKGRRRMAKPEARQKAMEALSIMGIEHLADRSATMVSGGQQQRIALARAVAVESGLLLMDEPLSNLDAQLREDIRVEIRALAKRLNTTIVYVTHDRVEAMALADRIVVLKEGQIIQQGTPEEIYRNPVTPQMADFLGSVNWLSGRVISEDSIDTQVGIVRSRAHGLNRGTEVRVGIRPEHIAFLDRSAPDRPAVVAARISDVTYLGEFYQYTLECNGAVLTAKSLTNQGTSGTLRTEFPADVLMVFPTSAFNGGDLEFTHAEEDPMALSLSTQIVT
jgi:iron(III) transport system ATP-binding protein